MDAEDEWTLRLGGVDVRAADVVIHSRINAGTEAHITVDASEARERNPDYSLEANLLIRRVHGGEEAQYVGVVTAAEPSSTGIRVSLENAHELSEATIRGLGASGLPFQELFWMGARTAGIESDRIRTQGWTPGPWEVFEVGIPIDGLSVPAGLFVSARNVRFSATGPVSELASDLGPSELETMYGDATAWGTCLVSASTAWDAVHAGDADVAHGLNVLALDAHYGGAARPDGALSNYRRTEIRTRPVRRAVVAVRGVLTGRRLLTSPAALREPTDLGLAKSRDRSADVVSANISPQVREAIASWRRALDATDTTTGVLALNDALEFCVAQTEVPPVFTRAELKASKRRAGEGLTDRQRDRLERVYQFINDSSFAVRLERFLDDNDVHYTAADLAMLARLRATRNDFVHGRSRAGVNSADLQWARSFTNRVLTFHVARVARRSLRLGP